MARLFGNSHERLSSLCVCVCPFIPNAMEFYYSCVTISTQMDAMNIVWAAAFLFSVALFTLLFAYFLSELYYYSNCIFLSCEWMNAKVGRSCECETIKTTLEWNSQQHTAEKEMKARKFRTQKKRCSWRLALNKSVFSRKGGRGGRTSDARKNKNKLE